MWEEGQFDGNFGRKQSSEQVEARVGKLRGRARTEHERTRIAFKNSKPYLITFSDDRSETVHGLKAYGTQKGIPYVTLFKAAQHGKNVPKYGISSIHVLS